MDSEELWSIELARSMEESFINTWTNALKLSVTFQLCQLAEKQQINSDDLAWVGSDVVSLGLVVYDENALNMSLQRKLVGGLGVTASKAFIPFLYRKDGEIMVQWVKPVLKIIGEGPCSQPGNKYEMIADSGQQQQQTLSLVRKTSRQNDLTALQWTHPRAVPPRALVPSTGSLTCLSPKVRR